MSDAAVLARVIHHLIMTCFWAPLRSTDSILIGGTPVNEESPMSAIRMVQASIGNEHGNIQPHTALSLLNLLYL